MSASEIFVSSSCVNNNLIKDSILELVKEGFSNIELSGGTEYYDGYLNDLLLLQDRYSIQYTVHNYFPPPQQHFMLNLSSSDDSIYEKSIAHCLEAIDVCKQIGSGKYGIHAGFLVDFLPSEAGENIGLKGLNRRDYAYSRFRSAWDRLNDRACGELELYVENNVLSESNYYTYQKDSPFLFVDHMSWEEFSGEIECKPLLDLAHLKVSSKSLGLSFYDEVKKLVNLTDYYHVSANDGLSDQNVSIIGDAEITSVLDQYDWSDKVFTIEVYDGMEELYDSYELLNIKANL